MAGHGAAGQGEARLGMARHGMAWLGMARRGWARHGGAGRGAARQGKVFDFVERTARQVDGAASKDYFSPASRPPPLFQGLPIAPQPIQGWGRRFKGNLWHSILKLAKNPNPHRLLTRAADRLLADLRVAVLSSRCWAGNRCRPRLPRRDPEISPRACNY